MIELGLLIVAIVAIGWGVNRHTKASTLAATLSKVRLDNTSINELVEKEIGDLEVAMRAKIDAMAKWLRAELTPKEAVLSTVESLSPPAATPAAPAPAAPAASDAVPPPAAAPSPPSDPGPSAGGGGTDAALAKIAEIDAAAKALQEHRAKLVAAHEQLTALL